MAVLLKMRIPKISICLKKNDFFSANCSQHDEYNWNHKTVNNFNSLNVLSMNINHIIICIVLLYLTFCTSFLLFMFWGFLGFELDFRGLFTRGFGLGLAILEKGWRTKTSPSWDESKLLIFLFYNPFPF